MVGAKTPNEADPTGDFYAFEKGAEKIGGGDGFADVWRRGYFGWEYKGKHKDLAAAYTQLLQSPRAERKAAPRPRPSGLAYVPAPLLPAGRPTRRLHLSASLGCTPSGGAMIGRCT